ncbi:MMPL family transporter, partial [Actinoplanes sp. NPDC051633]|uniref:MMPL family transporter n=1 Tax=Actinoplanes sp. NPDC051633 TaxID=3155670 RepID=UPI003416994A
ATTELSTRDLALAEAISLPVVLILLLFIFGSLVAASLPVLIGGCAVLGSFGVLHAVALHHDVNSFALNVASLLGLGMAIDYGLFTVGRFREEQEQGHSPAEAVARTMATAGRTVVFSASLLMIALGGLLLFPQGFLKSLAYGGLAAVGLAAFFSLTVLPAMLALLGPRVDKLPVRLPRRRNAPPPGTGWARLAGLVLRRPVLVVLPILAGLLILANPIRGVQFGEADERVLPASEPARQALEKLKADFPSLSTAGIQIVLRGPGQPAPFAAAVAKLPGIAGVTPGRSAAGVATLTATPEDKDPFGTGARDAVRAIRDLPAPAGTQVLVGGATARNVDSLEATVDRLPLMIGLLVGATLLLMFLAFGSVLLPVKAVVMSALSLAATFGVLVWVFQDGHGAGLLGVTPAPPEVGIVVLMAAVVFGLSTDYEVFLLSRMVEARTRGATTAEAVTTGLARTGRVISAAAVLLIVVTGAFALSSVTTMRFVGVGMILALVLDATVVRMLLVPAVLGLLGDAAWWAPGPLRRLQERAGLAEYSSEELFPTVSVGRHAAPDDAVASPSGVSRPRHASWTEEDEKPRPDWATERPRPLPVDRSAAPTSPAPGSPLPSPTTAPPEAAQAPKAPSEPSPSASPADSSSPPASAPAEEPQPATAQTPTPPPEETPGPDAPPSPTEAQTPSTSETPASTAPNSAPPTSAPPTSTPPVSTAPTSTPPVAAPPASAPPASAPSSSAPPTSAPPTSASPASAPPASAPPVAAPPASAPPVAAPPASAPPVAAPPATASPGTAPSASAPPTSPPPTRATSPTSPPRTTPRSAESSATAGATDSQASTSAAARTTPPTNKSTVDASAADAARLDVSGAPTLRMNTGERPTLFGKAATAAEPPTAPPDATSSAGPAPDPGDTGVDGPDGPTPPAETTLVLEVDREAANRIAGS